MLNIKNPEVHRVARELAALTGETMSEAGIVLLRREGPDALQDLTDFVREGGLAVEPATAGQAWPAVDAYRRFGKRRHEAALNFGDCFACALAQSSGQPLLLKGDDFARTDVAAVLPGT